MQPPNENEEAVVQCETSKGEIKLHLFREWSPHGYDRAVKLFDEGFYDNSHFFRVVPGFLVQFGVSYTDDAELKEMGHHHTIPDDRPLSPPIPFTTGIISFAGSGPNSRTSQLFITYAKHADSLGKESWETPIGRVESGMHIVESLYSGYGDMPPWGHGPIQAKIFHGPEYIEREFPKLDRFRSCLVFRGASRPGVGNRMGGAAGAGEGGGHDSNGMHVPQHPSPGGYGPGNTKSILGDSTARVLASPEQSTSTVLLMGAALVLLAVLLTWIRYVMKSKKNNKTS